MSDKKDQEKEKITKDTNLAEIVINSPEAAEVLLDYGLHCVGCALSPLKLDISIGGEPQLLRNIERLEQHPLERPIPPSQ